MNIEPVCIEQKRGRGRPWSTSRRVLALLAEGPLTARSMSDILECTPPRCVSSAVRERVSHAVRALLDAGLIERKPVDPREALGARMIYRITSHGLGELADRTPESG